MDKPNSQFKKVRLRRRILAAAGVIVVAGLVMGIMHMGPALPELDKDKTWIGDAKRGDLVVEVRAPGRLVPRDVRWLAAETSAQVEKVNVLAGAKVQADTVLIKLSNPELEDQLSSAKLQLSAAVAQLAAKRTDLQSQLLAARTSMAQAEADYAAAKVKSDANAIGVQREVVPKVDYEQGLIVLKQLEYRAQVERQRADAFEAGMKSQIDAEEAVVDQQRGKLALAQRQVDALDVRAGIDGVLQEMSVQEGQQVAQGSSLARVARPDVLIARLQVPEGQAKDVALQMPATVDTYNGTVSGTVNRIDPAVVDGTVRVDISLEGPLPDGARPDLAVDGKIRVADLHDVVSIPRPAQASPNATVSLFVLDADGDTATRRSVQLGAVSTDRAVVLDGVQVGERVIASDTRQWDQFEKVEVK